MESKGTPENSRDEQPQDTGSSARIQPGMSGSSLPFPEPRKVADVVPIRASDSPDQDHNPYTEDFAPPVWMQRANLVMKFLICVWMGMILSVLPWTQAWTQNSLIMSLPKLRVIFAFDFVKGMVTGIGLIDIWIGIWEAVHYRDHRPHPHQ